MAFFNTLKEMTNHKKESVMISGIDSSLTASSNNLNALKKAMDSEEAIMHSLLKGANEAQNDLQTQASNQPTQTPNTQPPSNNLLDIMA